MEERFPVKDYISAIRIPDIGSALDGVRTLGPCKSGQEPEDGVRVIKTACRACIANCGVLATVKNGRVVSLRGNPEDPMSKGRMCAKGLSGIQALYHPNRNKYPMQRVGERGSGKWKRISWDEALDTIAKKLMETREKYGAETLFCSTGGGGNPEIWSIARFCNIFGTPNWFEPGCAQCYLPRVLAYTMMYGGVDPSIADSNALELYFTDDTPIQALVLWGTDPSYSCPASGGGMVADLRAKGVKTVVVDPRFTPDAAKATVWLPIRPGTDVALQLTWIRYILEHKLYNADFVTKWTNLPYLVDVDTKMLLRPRKSDDPNQPDTYMVWDKKTNRAQPLEYPWNDELDVALEGEFVVDGRRCKTGYQLLWERCEEFTLEKGGHRPDPQLRPGRHGGGHPGHPHGQRGAARRPAPALPHQRLLRYAQLPRPRGGGPPAPRAAEKAAGRPGPQGPGHLVGGPPLQHSGGGAHRQALSAPGVD